MVFSEMTCLHKCSKTVTTVEMYNQNIVYQKKMNALIEPIPSTVQIMSGHLFYNIIFLLFYSSVGLVGTLHGCHQCPLPLSILIRMSLVIRQSNLPACLAEGPMDESTLSGIYATGLVKLTDKMDEIYIDGKSQVNGEVFCIQVCNFTVFQPRI